jgi:hypothetical protein
MDMGTNREIDFSGLRNARQGLQLNYEENINWLYVDTYNRARNAFAAWQLCNL